MSKDTEDYNVKWRLHLVSFHQERSLRIPPWGVEGILRASRHRTISIWALISTLWWIHLVICKYTLLCIVCSAFLISDRGRGWRKTGATLVLILVILVFSLIITDHHLQIGIFTDDDHQLIPICKFHFSDALTSMLSNVKYLYLQNKMNSDPSSSSLQLSSSSSQLPS